MAGSPVLVVWLCLIIFASSQVDRLQSEGLDLPFISLIIHCFLFLCGYSGSCSWTLVLKFSPLLDKKPWSSLMKLMVFLIG